MIIMMPKASSRSTNMLVQPSTGSPTTAHLIIGGIVSLISVIMILYFVIKWAVVGEPVEGWTSMFVLLLLAFGIIMITLSILGNYLWRCFESVKRKPVFIVEEEKTHESTQED